MGLLVHASLPPVMPGPVDVPVEMTATQPGRWKITHACEDVVAVLALAEAQAEIGMRPAVLTPNGWLTPGESVVPAPPVSLVHAWRKVRHWRSVFAREAVGQPGEILHAHSFSAAMAGIRAGLAVVYDVDEPIGELTPKPGPWLQRSLGVAENFALSRACAVVVHSQQMWNWAIERGVRAADLFLVPEPVRIPAILPEGEQWLTARVGLRPELTVFAPAEFSADRSALDLLLRAFAVLTGEIEGAHLLIEAADPQAFADCADVHFISNCEREHALCCADLVLAGDAPTSPNPSAIDAFVHGQALLAADLPANREVSPQGRGCIWYSPESERDLAYRASFLARNPDFRSALGNHGRAHLLATRGFEAVAHAFAEVYRHAAKRHRSGGRPDIFQATPALAVC